MMVDVVIRLGKVTPEQFFCSLVSQQCYMMFSVFIDRQGAVWSPAVVSSALYSNCLKGKGIKEQMHNWIYITHLDEIFIFWFLMKNAAVLQKSVCVRLGWLVHGMALVCVVVDNRSLTPGRPADFQINNIILYHLMPFIQLHWSSCSRLTHKELWFHLVEISLLMLCDKFAWHGSESWRSDQLDNFYISGVRRNSYLGIWTVHPKDKLISATITPITNQKHQSYSKIRGDSYQCKIGDAVL